MFKPRYLPYLKGKEVDQEIRILAVVFSVSLWEMWLFLSCSGERMSLLLLEWISTGVCANLLARVSPLGVFWPCCPHCLSRNHLSFKILQLTVNSARKEPDAVIPPLSQTWLLAEGLSVWFSFCHFFLFFPDKLTDLGVHLAMAQCKLYVITWEKQKWKASKSVVSGPGT